MRRWLGVVLCVGLQVASEAYGAPCTTSSIGVDISLADTTAFGAVCRGEAQTFLADPDTIISAITVWKPPGPFIDLQPRYLFIEGTLGGAPYALDVIYGPQRLVVASNDTLNPVPYRFVIDPPLKLPHKGLWAFVVQAGQFGSFLFSVNKENAYPEGTACSTGPVFECSAPGGATCHEDPTWDMCFTVEFCGDLPTESRKSTWGSLKMLYR